ncbi:MAG: DNA cytosine methyltransferase, partial [Planctomycetes bacterium]|nr:DNA cytosine methyltransferase [Planctomycetota bacterium]
MRLALPAARTVCYVEVEAFACEVLAAAMGDGRLDEAPVWTDLRTFDGSQWRGVVDCVVAGYPCQPFSIAGRRRGVGDPRHLWPSIARVLRQVRPPLVLLENVPHHLRVGFPGVAAELRGLGYRVAAGLFSAAEVGAPHLRKRLFVLGVHRDVADALRQRRGALGAAVLPEALAHAVRGGRDARREGDHAGGVAGAEGAEGGPGHQRAVPVGGRGADVADAEDADRRAGGSCVARHPGLGRRGPRGRGHDVADAAHDGHGGPVGEAGRGPGEVVPAPGAGGAVLPLFPPGPLDRAGWDGVLAARPGLAPALEPGVRGVADGMAARADRLRLLGNGVVPLVAAHAFRVLAARMVTTSRLGTQKLNCSRQGGAQPGQC